LLDRYCDKIVVGMSSCGYEKAFAEARRRQRVWDAAALLLSA